MKTTTHYSYEEVQKIEFPDAILISINGGSTPIPPLLKWKEVWEFRFDDVLPDGRSPRYKGKRPIITNGYYAMDKEQAETIADIIKANWDRSIHVHCAAGVSRSAAVAAILTALGWEYIIPPARPFGLQYANQHVISLLKSQFDQFKLIGQ